MAITKLLLLIAGVVAQEHGYTSPNTRPPTEQLREQHGTEVIIPRLVVLTRALTWTWALLEASVLFALSTHCPPAFAQSLLHALRLLPTTSPPPPSDPSPLAPLTALTTPTPSFVAGTLLALAGAALRTHCYATLGRHFTFELAIRPAHALVTRGAYSAVRHPSYVGVVGLAVGWMLCVFDPRGVVVRACAGVVFGFGQGMGMGMGMGAWLGDDGHATLTALLACAWVTGLSAVFVGICQRMDREDAMLEENFGEEWRAWVKRVPYRLVPGVY